VNANCPRWDYENHRKRNCVLPGRVARIVWNLRSGKVDTLDLIQDSRPHHRYALGRLTPRGHRYYAGNYRGSGFACLDIDVGPSGRPGVYSTAREVAHDLEMLMLNIGLAVDRLDKRFSADLSLADEAVLLKVLLVVASNIFADFLRVHPYLNGNGHVARLMVWALMGRYGYWPERFSVEPRPRVRDYVAMIEECRAGRPGRLAAYFESCLL
jgi:hypothetical protein